MLDYLQFNDDAPREPVFDPGPRPTSLTSLIGRIEQAVEEETAALRTDLGFDLKASNARKSRYLYELNRALKGVGPADLHGEQRDGIRRLREKLATNEAVLLAHLNAVNEVATLMRNAIQRHEADGTYSATAFQGYAA
ncbi:MAG: hypothetical protein KF723_19340 [Rhizobiaceae bacterium]|nr:hypothetical protein [Rhizobiaceae bacterium]